VNGGVKRRRLVVGISGATGIAVGVLREYITELETPGDLQLINVEVDWNLEIGAITRRS
jgi:hypothetical protein